MVVKTAWQAIRLITLLGGPLLIPGMAMLGPGGKAWWVSGIWEASWGVKWASAREPCELGSDSNGLSRPALKNQLSDQNNPVFSRDPSYRRGYETTSSNQPLCSPSDWGNQMPSSHKERRDSNLWDLEESGLGLWLPRGAQQANRANRGRPDVWDRTPEAPPLLGRDSCQMVFSDRVAPPSELLACQKDCQLLGRYLVQLGATEYSVHHLAPPGGVYWAWCRVKVLPNGSLWTRHVEATGRSPAEALAKIVQQVAGWQERRWEEGQIPLK